MCKIIIYQFGKVGSASIATSLWGKYYPAPSDCYWTVVFTHNHAVVVDVLNKVKEKIKIIMVVRFPVQRNISCFFENIVQYTGKNEHDISNTSINELIGIYEKVESLSVIELDNWLKIASENLSEKIQDNTFDSIKGYEIINTDKVDILLLRYEDIDKWNQIIGEFLARPFYLPKINASDRKWYGKQYNDFKNKYRVPEQEINDIRKSKYVNKFYTADEINTYIGQFSK
jgi:hypothetical protein